MLSKLIKGELTRLQKYNVTLITLLVALLWGGMLYFINDDGIFMSILPLIVLIDVSVMSLMYTGAVLYFEKSESTMPSLLVTPATDQELILSKIIANVIHQTISTLLVVGAFILIRNIEVNLVMLIPLMMLIIALHTLLGFVLTYHSKGFTGMLTNMMVILIILTVPSVLITLNVINPAPWLSYILLLSPIEQATQIINGVFLETYNLEFFVSVLLMIVYFLSIYIFYVKPTYKSFVQKGSGV